MTITTLQISGPFLAAVHSRGPMSALIALVFAAAAYQLHGVNRSGALAGAALSFVILLSSGISGFVLVAIVFLLAMAATRLGYTRKRQLGVAEGKRGRRAGQVFANLAVAACCAVLGILLKQWQQPLQLALVAALGEAAADTVASECGQAFSHRVYLITTFEGVAVGTDGGISLTGTLACAAAALLVAVAGAWTELIPASWVAAAAGAAFFGTIVDSLLGATLQKRGWLTNSAVNLFSTAAAVGIAFLLL